MTVTTAVGSATADRRLLSGAIWVSAIRCTITYLLIPIVAPVASWIGGVAFPFVLALHAVGIVMTARATRRSFKADKLGMAMFASVLLSVNLFSLGAQFGL